MSPDHTYTLKELADLTGKSQSTIQRKKKALIAAGATCDRSGWSVTSAQAHAVGLTFEEVNDRSHDTSPDRSHDHPTTALEESLRAHIASLESALQREHDRVAYLESQLDQERQERLLWTQGYLSETRALPPAEPSPVADAAPAPERPRPTRAHNPLRRLFTRR